MKIWFVLYKVNVSIFLINKMSWCIWINIIVCFITNDSFITSHTNMEFFFRLCTVTLACFFQDWSSKEYPWLCFLSHNGFLQNLTLCPILPHSKHSIPFFNFWGPLNQCTWYISMPIFILGGLSFDYKLCW